MTMNITPLSEREQEIMRRMGSSCPCCDRSWFLFPPVKIDGSDLVRCIECKEVFECNNPAVALALPPPNGETP